MENFDRKRITTHGKAVFYAAIYGDLREKALECGWALGLHGSLNSDMDIMAMPWTENATDADTMIDNLMKCFCNENNEVLWHQKKYINEKPNGRIVYTIPIWADFYIDLNIINNHESTCKQKQQRRKYGDLYDGKSWICFLYVKLLRGGET